jgi:mannitol/fructose-specific phosphotransferase system IIA component (Ntr-type)
MIEEYVTKERVKVGLKAEDWRELVDQVGEIMVTAGDVQPSYIPAMKQVIEEMGPYSVIAPGVVLLHARPEEGVNRICLALATLTEGINFGSKNDPVHLAVGLGALDHSGHVELLRELATFLQDKERVAQLIEAESEDELLAILYGQMEGGNGYNK